MTKSTEKTKKLTLYDLGCEALKKAGYKLTPTRTSVLGILTDSTKPQSIQTLVKAIGGNIVDQSTIYRTLESFLKIGLVEISENSKSRQTFFVLKNSQKHHIVTCRKCSNVQFIYDCPCEIMDCEIKATSDYVSVYHRMEFSGICSECYEKEKNMHCSGRCNFNDNYDEQFRFGMDIIRYRGYKLTKCREYVLKSLIHSDKPLSVQLLLDNADKDLDLDQSTVYRTLQTFKKLGLLGLVKIANSRKAFFEWKYRGHFHVVICTKCDKLDLVNVPSRHELLEERANFYGYHNVVHKLTFYGICPSCVVNATA